MSCLFVYSLVDRFRKNERGRMPIGRCVISQASRRSYRWRMHGLATRTPIQHTIGFAMVGYSHDIVATAAGFALATVYGQTTVY